MENARIQRAEVRGQRAEVRGQGSEVKDKVTTKFDIKIRSTHHLIELIKQGKLPDKIMMNVHPQRWNDAFVPWVIELVSQNVKNVVKRMIVRRERQMTDV